MSLPKSSNTLFNEGSEYTDGLGDYYEEIIPELVPDYFSYPPGSVDSFQNLSKSDYAKVIFYELYNSNNTVGCTFQITDNVHEDPCDYIGLFRVGYDNLSQCLASKILSQTECEDDGKLLRCTFKPSELPELENGFYQFLYVTRDKEVCGASMPFQIKNSVAKDLSGDEDVVAENSEDDFLVVRSNMAEKNRRLQTLLDEMTEKCLKHEIEMRKIHEKLKIVSEEKSNIEQLLKQAYDEKVDLFAEAEKVRQEKKVMCQEKEEAIHILREKNKVFSSVFEDYSEKLKEFKVLKDKMVADQNQMLTENLHLQDQIKTLTEKLEKQQNILDEKKKNEKLSEREKLKERSVQVSTSEDTKFMIEALGKLQEQLKVAKCENLILKTQQSELSITVDELRKKLIEAKSENRVLETKLADLSMTLEKLREQLKEAKCENLVLETKLTESLMTLEKNERDMQLMKSEITVLKLHIVDLHGPSKPASLVQEVPLRSSPESLDQSSLKKCEKLIAQKSEEAINLRNECALLKSQLKEKNDTIGQLNVELCKVSLDAASLTRERDSVQQNGMQLQDALNECIMRLNEGSELYKKQFRKIEKLKKKLKNQTHLMDNSSVASISGNDSCSFSVVETSDIQDEGACALPSPQNQNSDSDTGEHVVLRHPENDEKKEHSDLCEIKESFCQATPLSASVEIEQAASPIVRQVPELQTLIEKNLENFKNSQSKEGDVMYSIPCPVCDQDIGVHMTSTDELVKHLEVQHKQQVCPVCGRLFDMTLPPKYFVYHVEDHFLNDYKK